MTMRPRLVDHPDLQNVLALDAGVLPMLNRMQQNGIRLDVNRVKQTDAELRDMLATVEVKMERMLGGALYNSQKWTKGRFNPKSGDQVAVLLFDDLGISPPGVKLKMTKSRKRFQVDKKALTKLRKYHAVIPLLIEHTELSKLRDAFTIPLPKWVGPDGRVRTRIKYTRVATGRIAMEDPNMMQIPARTELGKKIRRCFIPDDGCVFLSVDQSQIEMRIAAHFSEDPAFMVVFFEGLDIHRHTASLVYGVAPEDVTDFQRTICKNVGFGILYGITESGLLDQILERVTDESERAKWTLKRCKEELIGGYFGAYPYVLKMMEKFWRTAKLYGYIWDGWGRVRLTPGVRAADKYIAEKTLREVGNHPIQGTAQGCMKLAMADCSETLEELNQEFVCRPLLQIHDELLMEVDESYAQGVSCVIQEAVENAVELKVPITSSAHCGHDWAEVK